MLDECGLTGDTLPGFLDPNPRVCETAAASVGLAFVDSFLAVNAGDNGLVAEQMCGLRFSDDLLGLKALALDVGEEFLLGAQRAVIVDVDELRREQLVEAATSLFCSA